MRRLHELRRFAAVLFTTALASAPNAYAQTSDARIALPGHVAAVLGDPTFAPQRVHRDARDEVALTIVLRRSDETGFQQLLADLYDPVSPHYRQWLTPQAIADRYGPRPDDYEAVLDYFRSHGFQLLEGSANRMTLTVQGTRRAVQDALAVTLVDFTIGDRSFHANETEPVLPSDIAARVEAVIGLNSLARPQANFQAIHTAIFSTVCALFYATAYGTALNGNLGPDANQALLKDIANCINWNAQATGYGAIGAVDPPPPAWQGTDGTGQKVGITAFDTFATSDVADFLAYTHRPTSRLANVSNVHVNGGASPGPNQDEVLLDIANVLMIAPGAQIVVYDAPFSAGSFQAMFNAMINGGVTIITNSWAYCESQTSAADVQSIDSILQTAAAAGISVFSASGDRGSTCLDGSPNTVHVPSSSPHITAVGGTSLAMGPGFTYQGETWWNGAASIPQTGQGGFGVSRFFPRPAWQSGYTTAPRRSIPDVSANADPAAGIGICQANGGGCPNGKLYGGTSSSAPAWAAMAALLNQSQGTNLGFVNPAFYSLGTTDAFHSPGSMGSDFAHVGLGSPNLARLHQRLTGQVGGPGNANVSEVTTSTGHNVWNAARHGAPLPVPADGTSVGYVVVRLADALGNVVPGKTITLTPSAGSQAIVTPPSRTTSLENGAAIFAIRNATPQTVTFTVNDTTDSIVLAQTATIAFVVPPAASGGINAFPTTVQNNGVATTTITVTLQDAQGNPTPGKAVTLSQGSGHSIITAPSPSITNASGQIQFTATNKIAETVTYTAVDVTDGNLPIPGSAVVTFSGQASVSCVGPTPAAASGYALTPFATGFLAEAFFYSNVNWGCAGATNPAFDTNGDALVASFRTGALYRMPPQGGAATSGQIVSNPGQTIGQPVWGNDGRLYAARSATGAGFFSGAIYELDPQTGATLRTLASGLACLSPLAVDPISGDLFYTGTCFGAGSNDPNLYRVQNAATTPTVVVYATLPGSPNGSVSFSSDGTMYVATQYTSGTPPVVRVSGTNQPQPPTITPIPGLLSNFWVTVAELLPNGAAKSLVINATDGKLKLANITTNPPTFTDLLTTGASSGVIGPDGCLYTSNGETVYKLTAANGSCGFAPTSPAPAIALTPAIAAPNPQQGTTHTITAQLIGVPPSAGVPVLFTIAGSNRQGRVVRTNASGVATLQYIGSFAGSDVVTADATVNTNALTSNAARVTWIAGKHVSAVSLNSSTTGAIAGSPVTLSAALSDRSTSPSVAISAATLQFSVAGQACNAITNASGVASCNVTIPLTGTYTLLVTFAGNASFTATTDARQFGVVSAPPPPCFAFNDVDSTSGFCANVEWIKNRSVTLGCAASLYCPIDPASRLQMAAFMNRLGTALTPVLLSATAAPGALDLDAEPVVCQTEDFDADFFDRRAIVDGSLSVRANADLGFAADAVASFDGGATWVPLAGVGNRGFAAAMQWGHLRASGVADLTTNQTVRFGIAVSRGGLPGNSDASDSQCRLRVAIASR